MIVPSIISAPLRRRYLFLLPLLLLILGTPISADDLGGISDYTHDPFLRSKANLIKTFITVDPDSSDILTRLTHILDYVKTREKKAGGLYPPFSARDNAPLDITDTEGWIIVMALAEVVRDLENETKKEQAFELLNQVLFDALYGRISGISPEEALYVLNNTVFDPVVDVIPEPSSQSDLLLMILLQALEHPETRIRYCAVNYLYRYASLVPNKEEQILTAIALMPGYKYTKVEDVRFEFGNYILWIRPIGAPELRALKKKPLLTLATEAFLPQNYSNVHAYRNLIKSQIQDGDPVSDQVRLVILAELRYLAYYKSLDFHPWISFFPDLLPTNKLTDRQIRTRESVLNLLENKVDTTPAGESLLWVSVLLHKKINQDITQYRYDTLFYGIEQVVRILQKLLYKEIMNNTTYRLRKTEDGIEKEWEDLRDDSVLLATRTLCLLKNLGNLRLERTIMNVFEDFLKKLAEKHPEWASEDWFLSNSEPNFIRDYCYDDAMIYYEVNSNGLNGTGDCRNLGTKIEKYIGCPPFGW